MISPPPTTSEGPVGASAGIIILIVLLVLFLLCCIALLIWWFCCRKKEEEKAIAETPDNFTSPNDMDEEFEKFGGIGLLKPSAQIVLPLEMAMGEPDGGDGDNRVQPGGPRDVALPVQQ